jgi:cytochrome oxidase Cu insertion factor (SCO1/SenC/PrrC family)
MRVSIMAGLLLIKMISFAQSNDEIQQKFLDSLKMGGTYLIGRSIPPFHIPSIKGDSYSNENLKGKITFMNFWFESCIPCIVEMKSLVTLYESFKDNDDFQFLSITYEKKEVVKKVADQFKMTYPILLTTIDTCNYLNFKKGFPTTIICNKKGEIVFFTFGGTTDPLGADLYFKTNVYPLLNCLLTCK